MKVLLYCDLFDKTVSDDTLKAIEYRVKVLSAANISYTLNPDDDYDIMEIDPAYFLNPFPLAEARRKGAGIVVNAHYFKKENDGTYAFSLKGNRIFKPVLSALLQKDDTIVVPSEYAADLLRNSGLKNRIISVPSPINDVDAASMGKSLNNFRDYFSLGDQRVAFGFGPMTRENGYFDFIALADRLPSYRFVWFGGIFASETISGLTDINRPSLPSNMICVELASSDMLKNALSSSDIVVFPRASGGAFTDVLQAMAHGALCLLRDQPLYSEFAKERKNCVIADSFEDLVAKTEYYIQTDSGSIKEGAVVTASEYTVAKTGDRYKEIYSDVMSDLILNRIDSYAKAHEKPDMLNIGLFCETYPPDVNGVAVSVRTLRNQLEAMGHNVYVITPAEDTKLFGTEFSNGILRLPAIKLKKLYGYRIGRPWSLKAMKYISKMNLDVIHNNGEVSMRLLAENAAKKYGIPMVYTYHTMIEDYTHYVDKGHFEDISKSVVNWYTKRMSEHYNRLIAPTEKTEKALLRYGVKKPIDIIPTGIDTNRFRPENIDPQRVLDIKRKLGTENDFTLCYVGRLAPEKNVDFILENLRRASDAVGGLKFVITGYGPAEEELKAKVNSLSLNDIVVFAGKQKPDEIQYYFAIGDVFVTASTSETQGLTYIEAMGAGIPVIARFDECLSNVLIEDVTGFEFTDGDSFVDAVVKFRSLSLERKSELRRNVLSKAEEYSLHNFGMNILRSYNAAIRDKRAENKIYDE